MEALASSRLPIGVYLSSLIAVINIVYKIQKTYSFCLYLSTII
jgi:hypothetical protein